MEILDRFVHTRRGNRRFLCLVDLSQGGSDRGEFNPCGWYFSTAFCEAGGTGLEPHEE